MDEAGVPGYEATIWLGLMAPVGTPKPIVEQMNAEVAKIVARPEVARPGPTGRRADGAMTPAEFDSFLRGEIGKWAKVVKVWRRRAAMTQECGC